MLSVIITLVAIASVAALYIWAFYGWREERGEQADPHSEVELASPVPVEGSDWELEYLLTADYARNA